VGGGRGVVGRGGMGDVRGRGMVGRVGFGEGRG